MNKKNLFFFFSGAVIATFLLYLPALFEKGDDDCHGEHCHDEHEEMPSHIAITDEQKELARLDHTLVAQGKVVLTEKIQGKVNFNPDKLVHLITPTEGIVKISNKNMGDPVEEGELLAVIESRELAEMISSYLDALRTEELAVTRYQKDRALFEKNIGSELELLTSRTTAEEATQNRRLREEKLSSLSIDPTSVKDSPLLELSIKAPFKGTVLSKHLTVGEPVKAGDEIYQIADLDTVWVELGVPYQIGAKLKSGQKVFVIDSEGVEGEGVVERISPFIQEDTGHIIAIVSLQNKESYWKPGTNISAKLVTSEVRGDTVVPRSSVVELEGTPHVFVKTDEGYDIRPVTIECQNEGFCLIRSGLKKGEVVVSKNTERLKFELTKRAGDHDH